MGTSSIANDVLSVVQWLNSCRCSCPRSSALPLFVQFIVDGHESTRWTRLFDVELHRCTLVALMAIAWLFVGLRCLQIVAIFAHSLSRSLCRSRSLARCPAPFRLQPCALLSYPVSYYPDACRMGLIAL
jgi:hypothetical protein